jgi:hypothetical protein
VVAAVGNGDGAPKLPWRFASYPAALPHVIGVGAAAADGSVPDFSNGDPTFDDVTAPGAGILSTVPRDLSTDRPSCQGYSACGPDDFRRGDGTSYAAAEVSAAAALLIAQNPGLMPDQVAALIERTADDMSADSGCKRCTTGRDDASGWGMLDIAGALQRATSDLPAPDAFEPNDDAGTRAFTVNSKRQVVSATLDFWDDPTDVYRVFLKAGMTLSLRLDGKSIGPTMSLWRPGTRTIDTTAGVSARPLLRAVASAGGATRRVTFKASSKGWYFVQVSAGAGQFGTYALTLAKQRPS